MPLLRIEIDPHPSSDGTIARPTDALVQSLERARDEFLLDHAIDLDDENNLCPRLPRELSFSALPEQQLLAYERHRENAELGLIFRIANGLHDLIDAVVVVGAEDAMCGARALSDACCDPFHNERSRAIRGSKPRIYYASSNLDNDHLQSLIGRLAAGGYGDVSAESNWAIVCLDPSSGGGADATSPGVGAGTHIVLDHVLEELCRANQGCGNKEWNPETLAPLVTSVGVQGNALSERLRFRGLEQSLLVPGDLRVPKSRRDACSVLTPAGLLTSAFLGLDCIQLLVGAAAINENFRNAPFSSNLVLQFLAANRACYAGPTADGQLSRRRIVFWANGFAGMADWCRRLFGDHGSGEMLALDPGSELERFVSYREGDAGSHESTDWTCHHVTVDSIRTDPLLELEKLRELENSGTPVGTEKTETTSMPQKLREQCLERQSRLSNLGVRQTTISLPVVDTHSLGQFVQMMMVASAMEDRLRDSD